MQLHAPEIIQAVLLAPSRSARPCSQVGSAWRPRFARRVPICALRHLIALDPIVPSMHIRLLQERVIHELVRIARDGPLLPRLGRTTICGPTLDSCVRDLRPLPWDVGTRVSVCKVQRFWFQNRRGPWSGTGQASESGIMVRVYSKCRKARGRCSTYT